MRAKSTYFSRPQTDKNEPCSFPVWVCQQQTARLQALLSLNIYMYMLWDSFLSYFEVSDTMDISLAYRYVELAAVKVDINNTAPPPLWACILCFLIFSAVRFSLQKYTTMSQERPPTILPSQLRFTPYTTYYIQQLLSPENTSHYQWTAC